MKEWNKKLEVMRHYDNLASVYDIQYAEEQNAKIKAALSSLKLRDDSLVLDAGCGTGLLFEHIRKSIKLVGIDISSRILKEAKKRVKRFPKGIIIRADTDFMPFQSEVFDAIFAITLLQNMPNPHLTLSEMKRVSKRQSIVVVTGLKKEFSQDAFIKLLVGAGLEVSIMKADGKLKGYVAICRKPKREKT